jgi:hypothetical protein
MSNNKQSSVEWLVEQLKEYDFSEEDDTYVIKIQSWVLTEKHEKAKAMHEKEIGNAHTHGRNVERGIDDGIFTAEQYYNETFGGGIQ